MDKLFTVAGTCVSNGVKKFKFANSISRAAVLERNGDTEISLTTLPRPMTKVDAIQWLKGNAVADAPETPISVQVRTKRSVGEFKEGMDANAYVAAWFAQAEARLAAKRKVAA